MIGTRRTVGVVACLALAAFVTTSGTASACHKKRCGGHRAVAVAAPTCHGGGPHYHAAAQPGAYYPSQQGVAPTGYGYPAPAGGRGLFRGMGIGGPVGFGGGYRPGYGGGGYGPGYGGYGGPGMGGYGGPGMGGYGPGW